MPHIQSTLIFFQRELERDNFKEEKYDKRFEISQLSKESRLLVDVKGF